MRKVSTDRKKGEIYVKIGENIFHRRIELGMTQHDVARATGINRASFANIENGNQKVSIEMLLKIAECYKCNLFYLLKGVDI